MIVAGCDVGSLSAEAVILEDGEIRASAIQGVRATASRSAEAVMGEALEKAGLSQKDLAACCATGYGRFSTSFAGENVSEISCHGLGAFRACPAVRTVIDVGGQDCKVIALDNEGLVDAFAMNDKCAAGTGRSLEILARALSVSLGELGQLSKKSRKAVTINNKCSIYMENEVLWNLIHKKKVHDIARGVNEAVARRVASLARKVKIRPEVALTGGVSKNQGVRSALEELLGVRFVALPLDPQLIGALGAAYFAEKEAFGLADGA